MATAGRRRTDGNGRIVRRQKPDDPLAATIAAVYLHGSWRHSGFHRGALGNDRIGHIAHLGDAFVSVGSDAERFLNDSGLSLNPKPETRNPKPISASLSLVLQRDFRACEEHRDPTERRRSVSIDWRFGRRAKRSPQKGWQPVWESLQRMLPVQHLRWSISMKAAFGFIMLTCTGSNLERIRDWAEEIFEEEKKTWW